MSKFPVNIPVKVQPPKFEQSKWIPMKDSASPYTLWKDVKSHASAINSIIQSLTSLFRDVAKLKQTTTPDFKFHPFKLYPLNKDFRPDIENSVWRTFNVRGGAVLTKYVDSRSIVKGTDGITYTDYNLFPSNFMTGSVTVPLNTPNYWFWIHVLTGSLSASVMTDEQYIVHYGSNPSTDYTSSLSYLGSQSYAWSNYPSSSTENIPIGYVDTQSSGAISRAYVRQYLRTDVLATGATSGSFIPVNVCVNGVDTILYVNGFFATGSGG